MIVRIAEESDAPGVLEAHTRAIRELCSRDYFPAQIEAWAGRLRAGVHLPPIKSGHIFVGDVVGRIAGFGEYDPAGEEVRAIQATNWEGETPSCLNFSEKHFRVRGTLTLPTLVAASPRCVHPLGAGVELACRRMTIEL